MRTLLLATAALAVGTLVSSAQAEQNYDVHVAHHSVTVTVHTGWHINQAYPWRLIVGNVKLDKSHFALSKKTATISGAPQGSGKIRGAVCSPSKCMPFSQMVTIR